MEMTVTYTDLLSLLTLGCNKYDSIVLTVDMKRRQDGGMSARSGCMRSGRESIGKRVCLKDTARPAGGFICITQVGVLRKCAVGPYTCGDT